MSRKYIFILFPVANPLPEASIYKWSRDRLRNSDQTFLSGRYKQSYNICGISIRLLQCAEIHTCNAMPVVSGRSVVYICSATQFQYCTRLKECVVTLVILKSKFSSRVTCTLELRKLLLSLSHDASVSVKPRDVGVGGGGDLLHSLCKRRRVSI